MGLKRQSVMTNEKQREIERRERDEGKMDTMLFFFSQHREQSMLGSASKAWSVLIQKRSYITKHTFGWIH